MALALEGATTCCCVGGSSSRYDRISQPGELRVCPAPEAALAPPPGMRPISAAVIHARYSSTEQHLPLTLTRRSASTASARVSTASARQLMRRPSNGRASASAVNNVSRPAEPWSNPVFGKCRYDPWATALMELHRGSTPTTLPAVEAARPIYRVDRGDGAVGRLRRRADDSDMGKGAGPRADAHVTTGFGYHARSPAGVAQ